MQEHEQREQPDSPAETSSERPRSERISGLLHSLKERVKAPADQRWYAGLGASGIAALCLLLPWMWLDDYATAHGTVDMIMFFPTHNDKWFLLRTTPLGTLTVMFVPIFMTLFTLANAVKAALNTPATSVAAVNLLLGLAMMTLMGEIADPDRARMGPLVLPHAGLVLVMLGNIGVIAVNVWMGIKGRINSEAAEGRRRFEW